MECHLSTVDIWPPTMAAVDQVSGVRRSDGKGTPGASTLLAGT
ncbi:hypothetical protein ACFQ10_48395 [Streptomyces indonesiensis]